MTKEKAKPLIVTAILALFALGFYLSRPKAPNKIAEGFNFHPDAVRSVSWKAGEKSETFTRSNRGQPWSPTVDAEAIQAKLNALGTLATQKMSAPGSGQIQVEVGFGPGNAWTGIYNKGTFVWTGGAKAGQGFEADKHIQNIFNEGALAFSTRRWNWCSERPTRMDVKLNDLDFSLVQKKGAWIWVEGKEEKRADSTTVERWLGKACDVHISHYRDLDLFPVGFAAISNGHFKVELKSGAKVDLRLINGFWIQDKPAIAFESRTFNDSLVELGLTPHP